MQQRASERVEARLVDRYYRLRPTEPDAQPRHSDCKDLCTISMNSVAVFAFDLPDGTSQRVQFEEWAHDWQHNTDFELGLPLRHADFLATPAFRARLRSTPSSYDPNLSAWDLFWEPVGDAAHWLLTEN